MPDVKTFRAIAGRVGEGIPSIEPCASPPARRAPLARNLRLLSEVGRVARSGERDSASVSPPDCHGASRPSRRVALAAWACAALKIGRVAREVFATGYAPAPQVALRFCA